MLIQIHGAGFDNRGGQLMLWTAMEKLRQVDPDVRIAVELGRSTYRERAAYDLLTLVPSITYRSPRKTAFLGLYDLASGRLPKGIERDYGLARRCDVDAFLDASGYAFGDKWAPATTRAVANRVSHFQRHGKPTVFLPQMLGPFESTAYQKPFRTLLGKATRVYARDQKSLAAAEELKHNGPAVRLAPDITIWTTAESVPRPDQPYACLVPNFQMIAKASRSWGANYLEHMEQAAKRIRQNGLKVCIVVHDATGKDQTLAEELAKRLEIPPNTICSDPNPRRLKHLLAGAQMTVGSRYHALVSSLSSGTPCVALGWAHKYVTLMEDFGTPEYCVSYEQGSDAILKAIDELSDSETRQTVSQTLHANKQRMQAVNESMWLDVIDCLGIKATKKE